MNRLEMAQEIAQHVPTLAQMYADEWRAAEHTRLQFVSDYSPASISALNLDEYVIGKGQASRAVSGAEFISQMPPLPPQAPQPPGSRDGKTDHEKRDRRARQIGDRGEAKVLALEEKRLLQAGKPKLARSIKHVSQENDNAG